MSDHIANPIKKVFQKECQKWYVCKNLNFHKKSVFSAVLGQKLATNLCPTASRSSTITPRHPQKLAPSMCFLALIGCLRPTTDFETLRKDPKLVFQFVKKKISRVNGDKNVHISNYSPCELKHMMGALAQSLRSVDDLKLPIWAWKQIEGASF